MGPRKKRNAGTHSSAMVMADTSKQIIGRNRDEDYISLLPDCLIHHIFSFLPTRDAVKTCLLSKRWRFVWMSVSDLRFSVSSHQDSFVDRVLTLYRWSKVKKYHLYIRSKHFYPHEIDPLVRFAIDHQVEELLLNFNVRWNDIQFEHTRWNGLYNCSSLTRLFLSGCRLSSCDKICWSSLKSLSIEGVNDDVLGKILMGSPVLEYLTLKSCQGVKGIRSSSLRELMIDDILVESPLHILTPRLLSLRVRGYYSSEIMRIVEAPSLLEAELDLNGPTKSDFCLLKEVLCKLQSATRVLFGPWFSRVMGLLKVEDVQVSLPNCKFLTLNVPIPEFSFPAIANMLTTTPNLEKLVIIFKPYDRYSNESGLASCNVDHESCWHIKKKFKRWAWHLKNVEILGFYGCLRFRYKEVFKLVKFLLGHAFVLENMVIKVMDGSQHLEVVRSRKLHDVAQQLQCYHRASKHAAVILNYMEGEHRKHKRKEL